MAERIDYFKQMFPSGTSKKCWSCDAKTDYYDGWCDECDAVIDSNPHLKAAYLLQEEIADTQFAGGIRSAIADEVYRRRRPPPVKYVRHRPDPAADVEIDLDLIG